MLHKLKQQYEELNVIHLFISVVATSALLLGMLTAVGWAHVQGKGDERWASKSDLDNTLTKAQIVAVVTNAVTTRIDRHEDDARFHPNDLVTRREFDMLVNQMGKMESNLTIEIRSLRGDMK